MFHTIKLVITEQTPSTTWIRYPYTIDFFIRRDGTMPEGGIVDIYTTPLRYCILWRVWSTNLYDACGNSRTTTSLVRLNDDYTFVWDAKHSDETSRQLKGTHDCNLRQLRLFVCPDFETHYSTLVLCLHDCVPYHSGLPTQLIDHILRILYKD